jgi:hypothetical protein
VDAKFLISGNSTFSFKSGKRVWTAQVNERVASKKAKLVEVEGEGYNRIFTPESWARTMGTNWKDAKKKLVPCMDSRGNEFQGIKHWVGPTDIFTEKAKHLASVDKTTTVDGDEGSDGGVAEPGTMDTIFRSLHPQGLRKRHCTEEDDDEARRFCLATNTFGYKHTAGRGKNGHDGDAEADEETEEAEEAEKNQTGKVKKKNKTGEVKEKTGKAGEKAANAETLTFRVDENAKQLFPKKTKVTKDTLEDVVLRVAKHCQELDMAARACRAAKDQQGADDLQARLREFKDFLNLLRAYLVASTGKTQARYCSDFVETAQRVANTNLSCQVPGFVFREVGERICGREIWGDSA